MLRSLIEKIKESALSVVPVTLIVLILSLTPIVSLETHETLIFIFSALALVIGMALFSLGADASMSPMGEYVGISLTKTKKIWLIVLVSFFMGLFITIAEPDLSVLGSQIGDLIPSIPLGNTKVSILIPFVGIGVGLFLVFAILKIVFKKDLSFLLLFFYMAAFGIAAIVIECGNGRFLPLSFDSGGVTTGPITVPFIMALGVGIATTIGGRNSKENSFGLISLCSIGPIIVLLLLGLTIDGSDLLINVDSAEYAISKPGNGFFGELGTSLLENLKDVVIALILLFVIFMIIEITIIKLPKIKIIQIIQGLLLTCLGLVIFLTAAAIGFLPIGFKIGVYLADGNKAFLIIFAFIIGLVVVFAEPAVHVLTKQVEEITTGGVSKLSMLISLSIAVGISICLAIIRSIFNFSILYYLIPGYLIALGLSFFVPKMYTAIAFDSGGVASGPMSSSFILPFAIGVAYVICPEGILENAFGIVAMIAMTPLITIQLLGFRSVLSRGFIERKRIKKMLDSADEEIISFED